MIRVTRRLLLTAAVVLLTASTARANLILNGGFEAPNIPNDTFQLFNAIPGWTLTSGTFIEIQDNVAGSPFEGDQFVELDSTANSGMIQSLATVAGQSYTFEFAYSPRPGVAAASNGIAALFNGVPVIALAENGIGLPNTLWSVYSFTVVATGALSNVGFTAFGTSNSLGGYIDDVRLTQVPEPASLSLFGLAVLGVITRQLRARRAR